jgi:hypothetical protein
MAIHATLTFSLTDVPPVVEHDGIFYVSLTHTPQGLPKGITMDKTAIVLGIRGPMWHKARQQALRLKSTAQPFRLVITAHLTIKDGTLLTLAQSLKVVETKPKEAQPKSVTS